METKESPGKLISITLKLKSNIRQPKEGKKILYLAADPYSTECKLKYVIHNSGD
jgi:hypothetical protein